MKTLFATLFLGFAFLFPNEQASINPPETTTDLCIEDGSKKQTTVYARIDFGRRSRNCRGFGICRGVVVVRHTSERGTIATLTVRSGRTTSIIFRKSSMSPQIIKERFAKNTFVVEEDVSLKMEHEGKPFLLELKAGKYKVTETKEGFNIGMPPMKG